jgi:hypothetical protein
MITRFKSALNQIKAEDELISKTEMYLKHSLEKEEESNFSKFINWRLFNMNKKLIVATCLAVLVVGGSGTGAYAYYKTPVSYLSLDINPSVELGVNSFDKVVEVEAYNEDGEKILEGVDVLGSNVTNAVNALVSSAADNGYIDEDGSTVVSVTSETDNTDTATELETEAENGANEALEENEKVAVINKDNVALARRDEARELGITPGKLNLINKLQAVDPTATVEMYKDASVKDIMKSIKNNKNKGNVNNNENVDNSDENESTVENIEQSIDKNNETNTAKPVENNNANNNNNDNGNINKDNANNSNKDNGNINKDNANNGNKEALENKGQANDKGNKVDTTKPTTNENGNANSSNKGNN